MVRYLILGASSDVGMEYIEHLIAKNEEAHIVGQYRNMSERLESLVEEAKTSAVRLSLIKADLTNAGEVEALIEAAKEEIECPDRILHLPAAKLHYRKIKDADWMGVRDDLTIQLLSLGKVLSAFLPKMAKQKYGRVAVLLSSVIADKPPKYMAEYAVVKNALLGLVKSAAVEYGEKNVYVSGLSPKMMETKLLSEIDEKIVALNAGLNESGKNYRVSDMLPYIDKIFEEESDCYNGVNIYPES